MEKDKIIKKNLDLHAEWMRYTFENPEVLDRIPPGAQLVIIPNDDPGLAEENTRTFQSLKSQGISVVIIRMDSPKLITPQIEFA